MVPLELRRPLDRLRERLHRTLNHLAARDETETVRARPVFAGPALDVEEADDDVVVPAELPGLRPQDNSVEATSEHLIIRAEGLHCAPKSIRQGAALTTEMACYAERLPKTEAGKTRECSSR